VGGHYKGNGRQQRDRAARLDGRAPARVECALAILRAADLPMIHSMTAFARVQGSAKGLSLIWEMRSVNHRFLETQFRLPEQMRPLEHGLRETLRRHVKRGKFDCSLKIDRSTGGDGIELNRPLLLQLLAAVEQIRRDAPEIGPGNAMDVLRWPGIIGDASTLEDEPLVQAATDLFEEALVQLIDNRQREGAQLASVISERLDEIDSIAREVKALTATMSHEVRSRLTQRLNDLKVQADEGRLDQEVALLAQRADVAEELDRLVIHVEEARSNLRGPGPHGRRLDFLTQELNREANTLGAKSVLAQTSQKAVDLKVAIEQIREQVQNVE
jgi:uncharacterized protein (TIGR00255 family)